MPRSDAGASQRRTCSILSTAASDRATPAAGAAWASAHTSARRSDVGSRLEDAEPRAILSTPKQESTSEDSRSLTLCKGREMGEARRGLLHKRTVAPSHTAQQPPG